MLPYALAIVVGFSSSILFVSAFLFKDLHRQDDFLWSGVGLFYALTLWFGSQNIRGSLLLGQLAAVCLLSAYFWQVWNLRTAIAKPEQNITKEEFSVIASAKNLFKRQSTGKNAQSSKTQPTTSQTATKSKDSAQPKATKPSVTKNKQVVSTKNMAPPTKLASEQTSSSLEPATSTSNNPPQIIAEPSKLDDVEKAVEQAVEQPKTNDAPVQSPIEESPVEQPEAPQAEIAEPIPEIQAEEITIVEEESNWDDEVEDLDPSSVTVIEVEAEQPETNISNPDAQNT